VPIGFFRRTVDSETGLWFGRALSVVFAAVALASCAHSKLSASDLRKVNRPAFVSWIEANAGPKSRVFQDDRTFQARLKKLDPKEADRRLSVKLGSGTSRFETSDRLRAVTYAHLPNDVRPWSNTVNPASVATRLESFLVEEIPPAVPPDYEVLKPLGADAVVEFVIQDYGLRSANGRAGAYVAGYGRMFLLEGSELWRQGFRLDQLESGTAGLDPFKVAQEPELFRAELAGLLDSAALQLARGLSSP
jgi:hypothetical protein